MIAIAVGQVRNVVLDPCLPQPSYSPPRAEETRHSTLDDYGVQGPICSKGPHLRGSPWTVMDGSKVEARGVEPRSETRFTTASTCVSHRLRSPYAGQ